MEKKNITMVKQQIIVADDVQLRVNHGLSLNGILKVMCSFTHNLWLIARAR